MSYEKISAALTMQGLKVSPAAVGVFCRIKLSKADIERTRLQAANAESAELPKKSTWSPALSKARELDFGRGGPRIARDDY